jgi:phage terminase large subunit GpA-like protein
MHQALDDPAVWMVVGCKSAQIAWTDGVILNYIGKRIDTDPCPMITMFAKEGDGKKFDREKFVPMVEVTPCLADKIAVGKTRDRTNTWNHKSFPGGFLNFVGSNSPGSVKSTPAPVVIVEEPDDANTNVKQQGDTITLLMERTKSYARRKIIFGGTPTIEGFSRVEAAYKSSDQREFHVPCPDCDELQTLKWSQVSWNEKPGLSHEVFGQVDPSSARYKCPHCGSLWTDAQKNAAVRKGRWIASGAFNGVAGFAINELYSPFPGSVMARLVEKRLTAEHALRQGDDTKMRSFVNNTEGRAYRYKSNVPSADVLRERAEQYAELSVPWGGLVLTAGVDVQHDRLAVVIRAWGRGEESWLVWWGEIPGRTMVVLWGDDGKLVQEHSGAWWDLDQLLMGTFEHECGAKLRIRAASIDSSDGTTQDAVYAYVRRRMNRGFMAIKGESHDPKKDIFTPPRMSVDLKASQKPHASGVRPYMVGTQVAKDLILGVEEQGGRIKLLGSGPGRYHWPATVRPDYWDQVTAEVKVPHRTIRGRLVWQVLSGRRNEALDCEVYALHAARSLKLYLWREERWTSEEATIRQPGLGFEDTAPRAVVPAASRLAASTEEADRPEATEEASVQTPAPPPVAAAPAPRTVATRPVGGNSKFSFGPKGYGAKTW